MTFENAGCAPGASEWCRCFSSAPSTTAAFGVRQGRQEGRRATAARGDGTDDRPARRARHVRLRRADAELAGGQHRGARFGLPRQARVHRGRRRQGGTGAVPDGPEAVPGAGRRPGRGAATQPGGARGRDGEPQADQAARRAERAVAEGSRRRAGPVRAGAGRRRAGQGPARGGEAQPLVHDDHVARRRRLELRGRRRRHVRQSAEQPAHHRLGADADVDQLQHLRERDAAHPEPGAAGADPAAGEQPVRRGDRARRRHAVPVQGQDHVRGSRPTTRRRERS